MGSSRSVTNQKIMIFIMASIMMFFGVVGFFLPRFWITASAFSSFGDANHQFQEEMEYLASTAASYQFTAGALMLVATYLDEVRTCFWMIALSSCLALANDFKWMACSWGWCGGDTALTLQGQEFRADTIIPTIFLLMSIYGLFFLHKPLPTELQKKRASHAGAVEMEGVVAESFSREVGR